MPKDYYTVDEVAEKLGKSRQMIRIWARNKKLPAVKISREWFFPTVSIDQLGKGNHE